ncbi:hypothetical protein B0J18DRAFT_469960 [Chaetomium sp. MPI-SDFR-AT-0129]|nr:hypothetical protein B0J18DRAFT_469960 [Chaetomium sp. MPI-SDFR-AT-0129]
MRLTTSIAYLALATAGLALPIENPAGASNTAVDRRQVCNPFDWSGCPYNKSTIQKAGPVPGGSGDESTTTNHSTTYDSIIEPEPETPAVDGADTSVTAKQDPKAGNDKEKKVEDKWGTLAGWGDDGVDDGARKE